MSREKENFNVQFIDLLLKGFSFEKYYFEIFVEIKIFFMVCCKEMEIFG